MSTQIPTELRQEIFVYLGKRHAVVNRNEVANLLAKKATDIIDIYG